MKDLVKRAKSFITFDFPLQTAYISTQFANTHKKLQTEIPGWSTTATRQKLISNYWFTYVAAHFSVMFGLPVLMVFFIQRFEQSNFYLFSVLIAGLLSYPVLYLFHYRPYFSSIFLPRLETVKETYERKQKEQLEKCRQAQLSNFALALVFYVFDKTSGINTLQCNDQSAELLMKLYGVDPGSIKKILCVIYGKKDKLTNRRFTEINNRFEEAFTFFEEMQFQEGIRMLRELEQRFQCSASIKTRA
jgi:hypothetical protein